MSKRCDFAIIVVHDPLAQLGERLGDNQKVDSSSLLRITKHRKPALPVFCLQRGYSNLNFVRNHKNPVDKQGSVGIVYMVAIEYRPKTLTETVGVRQKVQRTGDGVSPGPKEPVTEHHS